MDPDNNDPDAQKRAMVGKCAYNLLGIFVSAAWICGLYSMADCNFAERFVTLQGDLTVEEACDSLLMNGTYLPVCESLIEGPVYVGFWGFEVTVPVNQQVCYGYTITTPWGYVNPTFDTKFNSARALIVTSNILGGAAWLTLMFAGCCKVDQAKLKGISCYLFLAMLFQGLGLLFLQSSACSPGFYTDYFPADSGVEPTQIIQGVSCGLSTGAYLCISSTVLYFISHSLVGVSVVPDPFY
jgi:hypothetical protein